MSSKTPPGDETTRPLFSYRYLVRGRVQGVGFRYFVQSIALNLGIEGYVRNLDSGHVEVYAVGTKPQLDEFAGYLWKGPAYSEVNGVEESESAPESVQNFRIRH